MDYDPNGPLPAPGGRFSGGFRALLADGSVRIIPTEASESTLRAAITRRGGENMPPNW